MTKCSKGHECRDGVSFCTVCGTAIVEERGNVVQPIQQPTKTSIGHVDVAPSDDDISDNVPSRDSLVERRGMAPSASVFSTYDVVPTDIPETLPPRLHCTNCGKEMNPKAAICLNCGVKKNRGNDHCAGCGSKVEADQLVCVACGGKLTRFRIPVNLPSLDKVTNSLTTVREHATALPRPRIDVKYVIAISLALAITVTGFTKFSNREIVYNFSDLVSGNAAANCKKFFGTPENVAERMGISHSGRLALSDDGANEQGLWCEYFFEEPLGMVRLYIGKRTKYIYGNISYHDDEGIIRRLDQDSEYYIDAYEWMEPSLNPSLASDWLQRLVDHIE